MPLWTVHHPTGTYTPAQKRDFATDITGIYTGIGLPAFYVVVAFTEHEPSSLLIGGEPASQAVRIVIDHIAVHQDGVDGMRRTAHRIDTVIARHTRDRGLYSEFHVDETPRELWVVDGHEPPPFGSSAEAAWARQNRPSTY